MAKNTDTCYRGKHPWVDENIYVSPEGRSACRACMRDATRRYQLRKKGKLPPRSCPCGRKVKGRARVCAVCKDSRSGRYSISAADREYIYKRDGHRCLRCQSPDDLTIDHILPRALGGKDLRSNYQTLCRSCNISKNATYADYRPGSNGQLSLALEPPKPSLRDRFMAKVEIQEDGCWQWTGARVSTGSGAMSVDGRLVTAPRVAYQLFHGDVPDGEWVYRRCENQDCVAPKHLFSAAPGRGYGSAHVPHKACAKGHPYTPDNIKMESGRRRCKKCRNAAARRYARRKALQAT